MVLPVSIFGLGALNLLRQVWCDSFDLALLCLMGDASDASVSQTTCMFFRSEKFVLLSVSPHRIGVNEGRAKETALLKEMDFDPVPDDVFGISLFVAILYFEYSIFCIFCGQK